MEARDLRDVRRIRLLAFDLDGVLFDFRPLIFAAINDALAYVGSPGQYSLPHEAFEERYDGLSLQAKLDLLSEELRLPRSEHRVVASRYRGHLLAAVQSSLEADSAISAMLMELRRRGFVLHAVSTQPHDVVTACLSSLNLFSLLDWVVSVDDVIYTRPHPEVYYRSLMRVGCAPCQAIAFEDTPTGREAALMAGAHVIHIATAEELTLERVLLAVQRVEHHAETLHMTRLVTRTDLQVLIPCAAPADGLPSFLRQVDDIPMLQAVVQNLGYRGHYVFVVLRDHAERYDLAATIPSMAARCGRVDVVVVDAPTDGAARTCLCARHLLDPQKPLVIASADQYMSWDPASPMRDSALWQRRGRGCWVCVDGMSLRRSVLPRGRFLSRQVSWKRLCGLASTGRWPRFCVRRSGSVASRWTAKGG
eukprot:TRINITY_DN725_c2_g1_i3.p1 TRINITY_DN725_c2_g1~~TRINITY_DN725_c2_g1_i3.p1  ORF type:complete len:421 (-),score=37.58 TRINITY_DN725_c2_g1_i3:905-2167(-)